MFITIKNPQMQRMLDDDHKRFVIETRHALMHDHPHLVVGMNETRIEGLIRDAVVSGRSYGITIYNDLFEFVLLQFTYGTSFEDSPRYTEIKNILTDDAMDASVKLLQIKHWLKNPLITKLT